MLDVDDPAVFGRRAPADSQIAADVDARTGGAGVDELVDDEVRGEALADPAEVDRRPDRKRDRPDDRVDVDPLATGWHDRAIVVGSVARRSLPMSAKSRS